MISRRRLSEEGDRMNVVQGPGSESPGFAAGEETLIPLREETRKPGVRYTDATSR
jgi:hypothetical protein